MHLHTNFELMYTRLRSPLATYFLRSHFLTCFYKYHEPLADNAERNQPIKEGIETTCKASIVHLQGSYKTKYTSMKVLDINIT
mgnify:FL=1